MTNNLDNLLRTLDAAQPTIARRRLYLGGQQPLRFMADRVDPKVSGFHSNLARVAVTAVAERIRVSNITCTVRGQDQSDRARGLIQDSDFPMVLESIVTEALGVGSAYLLVWADAEGNPTVTGESATQVAISRDPIHRGVTEAVKRWYITDANGVVKEEHVMHFTVKEILHYVRDTTRGNLTLVGEPLPNNLGVVPVVPLVNLDSLHDDTGYSVVDDLGPLLDALNKLIVDMMTTSDAVARPKRYATGVLLEDDDEGFVADDAFYPDADADQDNNQGVKAPFQDSDDLWISEQAEARFGQLAGADLSGYKTAVDLLMAQIRAVTSLPPHMTGESTNIPSSADALRAAETSLATNASSRIRVFNRPVEWAVRLLVAVDMGVNPSDVKVQILWGDTSTRSIAQEADAAVKLHSQGITDTTEARQKTGVEKEI